MVNIYQLIEEIEKKNKNTNFPTKEGNTSINEKSIKDFKSSSNKNNEENFNINKKSKETVILNKTYIKINKDYDWFIKEFNKNKEKLQKIMKEKRELLIKIKEKENLKIKVMKNLESIKKDLYRLYALLLSEDNAPPVIVEKKLKEKPDLIENIKLLNNKDEKISNVNDEKNGFENKHLSIIEKIEKELERVEKELKELGLSN
jgi:hypothetical protein